MNTAMFYRCPICGNLIEMIDARGPIPVCCGKEMQPLVANSMDASLEKHVPVIIEKDGKVLVRIGATPHPMSEEHHIEWIYLHTDQGIQRKGLRPGMAPEALFSILNNEIVFAAYAYCNLHGLWKKSVE